jgi:hypothetical protein
MTRTPAERARHGVQPLQQATNAHTGEASCLFFSEHDCGVRCLLRAFVPDVPLWHRSLLCPVPADGKGYSPVTVSARQDWSFDWPASRLGGRAYTYAMCCLWSEPLLLDSDETGSWARSGVETVICFGDGEVVLASTYALKINYIWSFVIRKYEFCTMFG